MVDFVTRALVVAPRRRGSFTLKDSDESSDEVPSEEDEELSEDDQELSEEENIEAVSRFLPPLGRLRVECKSTAFLQYSSVLATPIVSISRLASLRKKAQDEAFLRFSAFRGLPDHDLQKWPGGGL